MLENEANKTDEATTPTETRREKFERERLSRRAALKKMGVTSGMALFAMFSVDDLAHMVGKAMKEQAKDNQIAELVAKELRQAGVAMATGTVKPDLCSNNPTTVNCEDCQSQHLNTCLKNAKDAGGQTVCYSKAQSCESLCNDTTIDAAKLAVCWGKLG